MFPDYILEESRKRQNLKNALSAYEYSVYHLSLTTNSMWVGYVIYNALEIFEYGQY
jgi:hypothetical protein